MKWTFNLSLQLGLVISCGAYSVTNKAVGDEVVLSPGAEVDDIIKNGKIKSVAWKHGSHAVVDLVQGEPKFYDTFKGRCKLDTTTGDLTIFNLTLEDSGNYTPEINKDLDPTELKVFSPVPKPTVSMSCDDEKTHCVLTCEGITTGVGPVTYTWWSGDVMMMSKSKQLIITKEEMNSGFICVVNNPVSSNSSEEFINPFNKKQNSSSSTLTWIFLGVVAVVAVVAVGTCVGVFCCKRRERRVPVRTNEHECEMVQVVSNGAALRPLDDANNSEPESSSQGQTSSVHMENETETVNDPLLGETNEDGPGLRPLVPSAHQEILESPKVVGGNSLGFNPSCSNMTVQRYPKTLKREFVEEEPESRPDPDKTEDEDSGPDLPLQHQCLTSQRSF